MERQGNCRALIIPRHGEFHHQNYTFGSVHEVCRPLLSSETSFTLFTRHNIVCLTPFWKISTTNHFTVLENCWLLNVELFWLSSFLGTTVSYGSFQGLNTRLEKQAKTTISNTQKPSTIGTSKLLLWDEIGRHFRWRKLEPYSAASQHNCEGASAINNAIPHNLFMLCKYH